jgi:broad specificity phosphatase PhoE
MIALLIRHASIPAQDTLGQRALIPLNTLGEAQARRLADRLKSVDVEAVFTSPLTRAVQTANALAAGRNIPVLTETTLREVDVGEWDNRSFAGLDAIESWKFFNTFRSGTRPPGGEMMLEVQARVVGFLERLTHEYGDATVAVVSHADVIRCAVCHYLGIPLDLSLRVQIRPASITTLRLSPWGAELVNLNDKGEWDDHSPE